MLRASGRANLDAGVPALARSSPGVAGSRNADPDRRLAHGLGQAAGARHGRLGRHEHAAARRRGRSEALSIYIVDQLYENVDVEDRLEEQLPPDYSGLAGPIAGALRQPSERAVDSFLQRPRVQDLWENINRAAHQTLLRVLEDETREGISTARRRRDARPSRLRRRGRGGARLRRAARRRLPADAGQVTVLESDQLDAAQTAVKTIKTLSWLVILLAIAAFAGAIWFRAIAAGCCGSSAPSSCSSGSCCS